MPSSCRPRSAAAQGVVLGDALASAGLDAAAAKALEQIAHKVVHVEPRRSFREAGAARDEVMFVRSGILAKFKADGSDQRQIVALRFPGEGILPSSRPANYGIRAIVRSEVLVGSAADFNAVVDKFPQLNQFLCDRMQRQEAISYEWLVNCGRRDSTARVAHLLCETAARSGVDAATETMVNPFTQQQIADITGQTSVNVNRVFADLERQKLIQRSGREIAFCDWRELRRIASFQSSYLD